MYLPPDQYISQCGSNRRPWLLWAAMAAGSLIFMALIIGAPLARANGVGLLSLSLYHAFSNVCHQDPARSFFVAGHPLAVCARCTGLYLGFVAAVVVYPVISSLRRTHTPERKWLFIAATPLAIDFGLGLFGIWENTHSSRLITAALLGIVTVFYIMPGLVELVRRPKSSESKLSRPSTLASSYKPKSNAETEREAMPASLRQTTLTAPSDYSSPQRRI